MPPKKKGAAPAKAKATEATRATAPTIPSTITTNRGKEIETTAAATRPKRETVPAAAAASAPKKPAGTKRGRSTSDVNKEPPTKRGRPSEAATDEENLAPAPTKRGPGRPPKNASASKAVPEEDPAPVPAKRGPGRPPKAASAAKAAPVPKSTAAGKKRGRPTKHEDEDEPPNDNEDDEEQPEEEAELKEPQPKRGRTARAAAATQKKDAPAVPENEAAPPKRRGRPPKGGETTRISRDDEAAAEQLEDELIETADEKTGAASNRKSKAPLTKKGKGKAAQEVPIDTKSDEGEQSERGKKYWLMKAEQEGHDVPIQAGGTFNTTFTIDDLRSKTEPEPWDGVRNPSAAKNMRDMKKGDLAFFYASGGKNPGIVGIMEIVQEASPDETAWNKSTAGFVEKEKDRDKWCVVHVVFRKKLSKPVYRSELQKHLGDGSLNKMQEFKAARLSVSKVSEDEWNFITENLVEGYEDGNDDEATDGMPQVPAGPKDPKDPGPPNGVEAAADAVAVGATDATATTTTKTPNDETAIQETTAVKESVPPNDVPAIMQSTEAEQPMTDIPAATSATSRRTSRAESRQPSVKPGGSRAGSRVGSLAPPAATSSRPGSSAGARARSRTPKPNTAAAAVEESTVMQTVVEEEHLAPA
ncbi:Thymocyte nuclear 1 [Lecanosticta acicola]|uniref:Thymocyte nuclear 1 n=1 Tax=Lecanosticta acicola TaxID=111012 RepID=A0AAI8Z110_9PEZI|nr:Thymocyte nuclear 1 [Lecanosticta acicola]